MFSVEPSAQCENVIKTRPAVNNNIQICERDFHCDQANTIIMIIMTRLIIKKQIPPQGGMMMVVILMMMNLTQTMIVSRADFRICDLLIQNNWHCSPQHLRKCWWWWWRWRLCWWWRWRWGNWERYPIKLPLKAFLAKYKWSTYTTELWEISGFPKTRFFETKNIPKMSFGRFRSCQCQC